MTEISRPPGHEVRRAFDAAASTYDHAAVLQQEVGRRLLGRLDLIRLEPRMVLDVGAGTGLQAGDLRRRYRKARVIALDVAAAMLRRARGQGTWLRPLPCIQADAAAIPLADASVDLLFSNMTIQWCGDADALFREFQRVLRPGGLLLFSTVGPDTLRELRASWAAVDDARHVNSFADMHDLGDALVRTRFADPVVDMEPFTLTYPSVRAVIADLRATGANTVLESRRRGLLGRRAYARLEQAYAGFADADGRLPATWEVVYGHAWATDMLPQQRRAGGAVVVSADDMRRTLRRG